MLPVAIDDLASSSPANAQRMNVLLLGAGPIIFGTTEGPWNHSKRLEQKLGTRLIVVGLIDRDLAKAERALTIKRNDDTVKAGYANTRIFSSLDEAGPLLQGPEKPHLAVLGYGPLPRGSTRPGKDAEIQIIKHFPEAAIFIEKPISSDTFEEVDKVAEALRGRVTSVGYMLRYLKAVQEMKRVKPFFSRTLADDEQEDPHREQLDGHRDYGYIPHGLVSYAAKVENLHHARGYWDKSMDQGPVVSQATHICDLARYLAPPPVIDSIHVHTVEHTDPAGKLSLDFDENDMIAIENRIPRITNAIWQWEGGATGHLLHGVALAEGDYDCELVVLANGWKLRLVDPYGTAPRLYVRRPGLTEETRTVFTDDDCYFSEFSAIIDVIDGKADRSAILSTFQDAADTYKLTWAIRLAGEEAYKRRLAAAGH